MCLSSPYLIFCDIVSFKINSTLNLSIDDDPYDIIEECRTTSDATVLWNYVSGWYPTAISYIIPTIVINYCYIRIMLYVSHNTGNIAYGSVRFKQIFLLLV